MYLKRVSPTLYNQLRSSESTPTVSDFEEIIKRYVSKREDKVNLLKDKTDKNNAYRLKDAKLELQKAIASATILRGTVNRMKMQHAREAAIANGNDSYEIDGVVYPIYSDQPLPPRMLTPKIKENFGVAMQPAPGQQNLDRMVASASIKKKLGSQGVAEGSAHGYNVAKWYEKNGDQLKLTRWLRKEAGLPKDAPVYFDDADLVYGDKTIVPGALVNPKLKFNDLLTALTQATGGQGKQNVDGVYRESGVAESIQIGSKVRITNPKASKHHEVVAVDDTHYTIKKINGETIKLPKERIDRLNKQGVAEGSSPNPNTWYDNLTGKYPKTKLALDLLPPTAMATSAVDAVNNLSKGNYGAAAVDAAGLIPGVKPLLKVLPRSLSIDNISRGRKVGRGVSTVKDVGDYIDGEFPNEVKENFYDIDPADHGEYNREGEMARQDLVTAADAANELRSILSSNENLPEWVQAKITKAVDYLDTTRDYMKAKHALEEAKKGLYYYVNRRKKSGISRRKNHPKAPTAQAWKDAAKTAKKK